MFAHILARIPNGLVSPAVKDLFKKLVRKLPKEFTRNGLFECPLDTAAPVSDLSFYIRAGNKGREILAGNHPLFPNASEWHHIRSFAASWARPGHPFHQNISHMGIEFDLAGLERAVPVPGVFFNANAVPGRKEYNWIADGLACLRGDALPKTMKARLTHCLEALPQHAGVAYAAVMLSRPGSAVRLVLCIPRAALGTYLTRINYPDNTQEVTDLAAGLSQTAQLRYSLDISHTVSPRIGIECFPKEKTLAQQEKWPPLLNYFSDHALALPEKTAGLLDWLKKDHKPGDTRVLKKICHIKVLHEPGNPLTAKAYPEFCEIDEMDLLFAKLLKRCAK